MGDRFQNGQWRDPLALPEHQRSLHRRIMAAVRAERARTLAAATEQERRWPGLVKRQRSTNG